MQWSKCFRPCIRSERIGWLMPSQQGRTSGPPSWVGFGHKGHWARLLMSSLGRHAPRAVSLWCEQYDWALSSRLSIALYGEAVCHRLVEFWCQKMQFWYDLYLASGQSAYVYSERDVNSWVEPLEFTKRVVGASGPAVASAEQIRASRPSQRPKA